MNTLALGLLHYPFGIYQLRDGAAGLDWLQAWRSETDLVWSLFRSPREVSLLCPVRAAPADPIASQEGWRGVYFAGQLDFSLVGVLSRLTGVLADVGLGVLAVSTYDTDYVFVPEEQLAIACEAMRHSGYSLAAGPGTATV